MAVFARNVHNSRSCCGAPIATQHFSWPTISNLNFDWDTCAPVNAITWRRFTCQLRVVMIRLLIIACAMWEWGVTFYFMLNVRRKNLSLRNTVSENYLIRSWRGQTKNVYKIHPRRWAEVTREIGASIRLP
jgi:hypothetical protein